MLHCKSSRVTSRGRNQLTLRNSGGTNSFVIYFTRLTEVQTGLRTRLRFPPPPVRHRHHYSVSHLSCSSPEGQADAMTARPPRFPEVAVVCFLSVCLVEGQSLPFQDVAAIHLLSHSKIQDSGVTPKAMVTT